MSDCHAHDLKDLQALKNISVWFNQKFLHPSTRVRWCFALIDTVAKVPHGSVAKYQGVGRLTDVGFHGFVLLLGFRVMCSSNIGKHHETSSYTSSYHVHLQMIFPSFSTQKCFRTLPSPYLILQLCRRCWYHHTYSWSIHFPRWWFGTMEFYDFPFSWEFHHPNSRTHIFQRGRLKPPTSFMWLVSFIKWWCTCINLWITCW